MSDLEEVLNRYEQMYIDTLATIDEKYGDDYNAHKYLRGVWEGKLEVIKLLKQDLL